MVNELGITTPKSLLENISNLVSSINEVNNTTPKLLTRGITWTVGTGGDFTNLQSALNEASKYITYNNSRININLKSGYVIDSINCNSINLSLVNITSEDSEVSCNGNIIFTKVEGIAINTIITSANPNNSVSINLNNFVTIGNNSTQGGFKNFKTVSIANTNYVTIVNSLIETSDITSDFIQKLSLSYNKYVSVSNSIININIGNSQSRGVDGIALVGTLKAIFGNDVTINFNSLNPNSSYAIRIYHAYAQISSKTNINGKCSIAVYRFGRLNPDNAIINSTNNSEPLVSLLAGGMLTFIVKPTITHAGAKCNIPYGQLTADGSFCQDLE